MQHIKLPCAATKWWSRERLVTAVQQRLVVGALVQWEGAKPCVPGGDELSQERRELLLYPPDLCAGQRGPEAL